MLTPNRWDVDEKREQGDGRRRRDGGIAARARNYADQRCFHIRREQVRIVDMSCNTQLTIARSMHPCPRLSPLNTHASRVHTFSKRAGLLLTATCSGGAHTVALRSKAPPPAFKWDGAAFAPCLKRDCTVRSAANTVHAPRRAPASLRMHAVIALSMPRMDDAALENAEASVLHARRCAVHQHGICRCTVVVAGLGAVGGLLSGGVRRGHVRAGLAPAVLMLGD